MIHEGHVRALQETVKVISSAWGQGEYKETLESAREYQSLESSHGKMIQDIAEATEAHNKFLGAAMNVKMINGSLKNQNVNVNDNLSALYDSI